MESTYLKAPKGPFHPLKVAKIEQLTKTAFALELEIPSGLKNEYLYEAGQYVTLKYLHEGEVFYNDYSMTGISGEKLLKLGIKINSPESSTQSIFDHYKEGATIEVSLPKGRFTIPAKPHEFRTIVGFAAGIGITPILSHFKTILKEEPRSRLFLFYGNKSREDVAYKEELESLEKEYKDRLEIYHFYSRESLGNAFIEGRLDEKKVALIINQVMMLDDTDEESTLWDSVDHVLICGKGEMIRSIARACYENGIPKKNIHFELFQEFNEDIYPVEVSLPGIENIEVEFLYNGEWTKTTLDSNKNKILQSLSEKHINLPFSCKSGICGSCECKLVKGKVELLENEYLTEKEEEKGHILACMSYALEDKIVLDFDHL